MDIKIQRIAKDLELPRFAKEHDAALDLRSSQDDIIIAGEKKLIKTGIKIAIPRGHVGLIWDRSGMAHNHFLHTLAGVIDSGYRGEVGVVMTNMSKQDFRIERGMRIAQMLIQPVLNTEVIEVDNLDDTLRGESSFGSTGIN